MVGLSTSELPVETLYPGFESVDKADNEQSAQSAQAFVAGDPRGHRIARILRVNCNDDEFPIEVDTQELLPQTIMLKRKRNRTNADISSDDAKWRKLRTFRLEDGEAEGETRADRLNDGLNKSLLDAMKSTKIKLAMVKQEESNARSKKLMQMFLTKRNAALDEGETTSSVLDNVLTPERKKRGKLGTFQHNADHHSSAQPHERFALKINYGSDKASRRSRSEDETAQAEWKCKFDSKKHDMRKRRQNVPASARPKKVDTKPRTRSISKYFRGKQEQRRPKKRQTTDVSKFMNHVQEAGDVVEVEEQKRIVWGLNEYYALDNKAKTLEADGTGSQGHSRESSSNISDDAGKTAWSQQRKNYPKMNRESDALHSWLYHKDVEEVSMGTKKAQRAKQRMLNLAPMN